MSDKRSGINFVFNCVLLTNLFPWQLLGSLLECSRVPDFYQLYKYYGWAPILEIQI